MIFVLLSYILKDHFLSMRIDYKQLESKDYDLMNSLLDCFGKAFDDEETYVNNRPDSHYIYDLLNNRSFIALVALVDNKLVDGLVAYELIKFEQKRSEVYIYDLAVDDNYRRKGIATSLIETLRPITRQKNAWVIYVQADHVDEAATNLYTKLGVRENVLHFDIPIVNENGKR